MSFCTPLSLTPFFNQKRNFILWISLSEDILHTDISTKEREESQDYVSILTLFISKSLTKII